MQPTIQQALRRIIRSQPQSAHWAAKVFQNTAKKSRTQTSAAIKDLIRQESEIGSKLFGEIPSGHKREFFCLDSKTWVWRETWRETLDGDIKDQLIRYEVRSNGILKSVNGEGYQHVSEEEANNLAQAAVLYHQYVSKLVYKKDSADLNNLTQQNNKARLPRMDLIDAQP
jgi:hypothetical protein